MTPKFRMNELRRLYPALKDLRVAFHAKGVGLPETGKSGAMSLREGNLASPVPCANPDCSKGGHELTASLHPYLEARSGEADLDIPCGGFVGSRRTERGPAPCPNRLQAKVTFAW